MDRFSWEARYAIGHAEIDAQHRRIIAIMNRLYALLADELADRQAEAEAVLAELADYVATHFAYEEALMLRAGYPPDRLADHKVSHDALVARLQVITHAHRQGDTSALANLLPFLYGTWLIEHICETDRDYAEWVVPDAAAQSGATGGG